MSEQNNIQKMQQTINQLRTNAKGHKKTLDKVRAKVSQLTQQRDDAAAQLSVKEQEAAFYKAQLEEHCTEGVEFTTGNRKAWKLKEAPKRTTWPSLFQLAIGCILFGFLFGLGALGSWGWVVSGGHFLKDIYEALLLP